MDRGQGQLTKTADYTQNPSLPRNRASHRQRPKRAPRPPPPPGPLFTLSPLSRTDFFCPTSYPVKSVVTSPLAWIDVGTVYLRGIVEITDEG